MSVLPMHHEGNSKAPFRCKSFAFDVNQQAESLVRWDQRYNQHSQGAFSGYLDELKLGGVHLFEEFTSQKLSQQCCVSEESIWLGFSQQRQRPRINGSEIQPGQLMIRPSGVEFELLTPRDFHIYGLVLSKQSIADELQGLDKELWLKESDKLLITAPNSYVTFELAKTISLFLSEQSPLNVLPTGQENIQRLSRLAPLLVSHIAGLLVSSELGIREFSVARPEQQRVIKRILDHVASSGRYPLTVTELCQIGFVSRRNLQYCFEHELGVSPMQYLRDCRLNEIRRHLIRSQSSHTISNLAVEYGFYHISTFNQHYKQLFGETPTQTCARASAYQAVRVP